MHYFVRVQNWFFRQILIFPLRLALIIVAMVVLAGWGLLEHDHPLTSHFYPLLVVLALANLVFAFGRRRRKSRPAAAGVARRSPRARRNTPDGPRVRP